MDLLVQLKHVGFRYRGAKLPILKDVHLTLRRGDRILLRGRSGSGKSTLLAILSGLAPEYVGGTLSGAREIFYRRRGVVLQNPEAQVVTPTVEEEVAFALENQGKDPGWIRNRVRETLEALGIAHLAERHPLSLSGGECQRVSLAAALAMDPEVLFLDEPTSYLDEVSSQRFFEALDLLHPDTALVVVEHRLQAASRVCRRSYRVEEDGSLHESDFTPERQESEGRGSEGRAARRQESGVQESEGRGSEGQKSAGRQSKGWESGRQKPAVRGKMPLVGEPAYGGVGGSLVPVLEISGLSHRWPLDRKGGQKGSTELFHDLHLTVSAGEVVALLGPSGAGKTTLLGKISGRLPVEKGRVFIQGKDIATLSKEAFYPLFMLVPQNPEHMFLAETVREELVAGAAELSKELGGGLPKLGYGPSTIEEVAKRFGLSHRLQAHPFRLSEGEKRRLNLAVAFAVRRPLYLLDEPTYGLDDEAKALLREDLRSLVEEGAGVLLVTHDRAFAEVTADTVYTLKEGQLVREEKHAYVYCPA